MYEDSKQMLIEDSIRRKILDAAIEIINEEGYENLTIRKVAKMSGCSNSAIYMRFEDKDALARAVAALYAKPFLRLMDDNSKEEDSFIQNMNRIAKAEYDRIQEMDSESVHLQMVYRGSLPQNENPFLLRLPQDRSEQVIIWKWHMFWLVLSGEWHICSSQIRTWSRKWHTGYWIHRTE